MITDAGRDVIGRYLALDETAWAGYISLGIGSDTINVARTDLVFEVARAGVFGYRYDPATNTVYVRAQFENAYDGPISEVGLWSEGEDGTVDLFSFDDDEEVWDGDVVFGGGVTDPTYMSINGTATTEATVELFDDQISNGTFRLSVDGAGSTGSSLSVTMSSPSGGLLTLDFTIGADDVVLASKTISGDVSDTPLSVSISTTGGAVIVRGMDLKILGDVSSELIAIESAAGLVASRQNTLVIEMGVDI